MRTVATQLSFLTLAPMAVLFADAPPMTADQVLAKYSAAESERDQALQSYTVKREYRLVKPNKMAAATVEFRYQEPTGESYRIVKEDGQDGWMRFALRKIIAGQTEAVNRTDQSEVSARNYNARLLGTEMRQGRLCYLLELMPKRKSKYLLNGKAWIDAKEFALVRIEGRPSASLSFWVGKPWIEQDFKKVGDYWLMGSNKSVADARIVGTIELTIDSQGYSVTPPSIVAHKKARAAQAPPSISSNLDSSITSTFSERALSSFEPASSPASR